MTFNAVVTGATGFIGSALVKQLLANNAKVAVVVRKNSANLGRLPESDGLSIIEGELNNLEGWHNSLSSFEPDVFFHLAWNGVGNTDRNSKKQLSNIMPTVESVELAKRLGCRMWIGTGSQAEYGPLNRRISEEDPAEPTTLYGAAKLSAGNIARIQGNLIGIDTVWVRIFSTYGPGDNGGWLLPDLIDRLLRSEQPALTLGEQFWDYLYVTDAANALFQLASSDKVDGIYNLGSGYSQRLRAMIETIRDMIDPDLKLGFGEVPYRPDQVMHLEANTDKLARDTGWMPSISFEKGVRELIDDIKKRSLTGEG